VHNSLVGAEVAGLRKSSFTLGARIRPLPRVRADVDRQNTLAAKLAAAVRACVTAGVNSEPSTRCCGFAIACGTTQRCCRLRPPAARNAAPTTPTAAPRPAAATAAIIIGTRPGIAPGRGGIIVLLA